MVVKTLVGLFGVNTVAVQINIDHGTIASSCESGRYSSEQLFSSYIETYSRAYRPGSEEYSLRKGLFDEQLSKIEHHNCKPDRWWTASLNKFSDRTRAELSRQHGYIRHARSSGGRGYTQLTRSHVANKTLPEEVSYTNLKAMQKSEVMDQGSCGSCWAIATSLMLRAHSELSGKPTKFSTQEIVSCAPNPKHCGGTGGCEGSTGELALDYVMKHGLRTEEEFPYQAADIECPKPSMGLMAGGHEIGLKGWTQLPSNRLQPLMAALAEKGPVAVSVAADDWWFLYSSGILTTCSNEDPIVNHLVVLIGYGREHEHEFWEIQNSWGSSWGENGHMRLIRSDDEEEYCGMDSKPQDGVACEGEDDPVKVCGHCGMLYDTVVPDFGAEKHAE